ncbi:putative aldolase class 2 protein CC_1201 [Amphiura filiformis]|uniref:putative aldolase class 2 protein CC_1201 n=1 Tax=Amphiura filiformis TaxID=82378 RepID=UPI003B213480
MASKSLTRLWRCLATYRTNNTRHVRVVCPGMLQTQALIQQQVARLSTNTKQLSADTREVKNESSNHKFDNLQCRVDLAAAYQILEHLGFEEGIDNHLTLRAPSSNSGNDVMLVIPYGLHWSQVTASQLIGVDFESGETIEGKGTVDPTAFCIHRAIHRARSGDGAKCVMHTHQPYATALACLKDSRLLMLHQNSARFHGRIAYDQDFDGIPDMDENVAEGDRMARVFRDNEILLHGNHGVTAIGPTVAYAFNALYFLERVCQLQVLAMSTGRELSELPEDQVEKTAKTWPKYDYIAPLFFNSMKDVIIAKGSRFMT